MPLNPAFRPVSILLLFVVNGGYVYVMHLPAVHSTQTCRFCIVHHPAFIV